MNKQVALSLFGAAVLASVSTSGRAAELLLNGSFEGPIVVAGQNNLGTVPDSWTVQNSSGTTTASVSNLTRGIVTNGTGNTDRTHDLPLDPFDAGSQQSLDISNTGSATQTFTALFNAPATVKFDIGGRDTASGTSTGSYWSIYNNATNALVVSSSANALKPAFGAWATNTSSTGVSLVANTVYRFVITLDNPHQVDGLSIVQVPEPTTVAATSLGLGLLGWLGYKRRRRS